MWQLQRINLPYDNIRELKSYWSQTKSRSERLWASVWLSAKEENRCTVSVEAVDREESRLWVWQRSSRSIRDQTWVPPSALMMCTWGLKGISRNRDVCRQHGGQIKKVKDSLYSKSTEQVNGDYGIEMKKPVKASQSRWRRCTRWWLDNQCCGHQQFCGCGEKDCWRKLHYLQGIYAYSHLLNSLELWFYFCGYLSLVPSTCVWGFYT